MKPLALIFSLLSGSCLAEVQPNILLILADDCTYTDLEIYGGQAKTPHLRKLAAEGMKFTNCSQSAPMCSPTRHSLYTGLHPVKSGAYPNHTAAYPWVKSIATYLRQAGYGTHLSGKNHVAPKSVFPFQYSGKDNNPDPQAFQAVLESSSESGKPFLFIAASNEPHSPWDKGDASAYPPESLKLPPIFVDSPDTRSAFSNYLAEVTYFDSQVGELLGMLDKAGMRGNTLVIVLSEQGNSFPFAKWTCYEAGLASGCIVRWPVHVKAGSVSDAMIEYVDVTPTFLEIAGVELPEILDGRSFLPVLLGEKEAHKSHAFGLQTTRGINDGSDHFAIRTVRGKRYRYIRNLTPEAAFQNAATADKTFRTWQAVAEAGDENAKKLVHEYMHRPAEELYDCQSDPWNRKNLIGNKALANVREELSKKLDDWMVQQGDKGQETEMAAYERMPRHSPPKGK
jgi:N-sulfoglucosamine sulfohydrolase